jgi:hypothetical protein
MRVNQIKGRRISKLIREPTSVRQNAEDQQEQGILHLIVVISMGHGLALIALLIESLLMRWSKKKKNHAEGGTEPDPEPKLVLSSSSSKYVTESRTT